MATIPSQATFTPDQVLTAAALNDDVRDAINFFKNAPSACAFHNVAFSLTNNVTTAIDFDSERWDNDVIHDAGSPTKLICKTAGVYVIDAHCVFDGNATGEREAQIVINDTIVVDKRLQLASAFEMPISLHSTYKLAVNDYVELYCRQNSGGALNLESYDSYSPELRMTWLSVG